MTITNLQNYTWTANDNINLGAMTPNLENLCIDFISNNINYVSILFEDLSATGNKNTYLYYQTEDLIVGNNAYSFKNKSWENNNYKTIKFLSNLKSNSSKQLDDFVSWLELNGTLSPEVIEEDNNEQEVETPSPKINLSAPAPSFASSGSGSTNGSHSGSVIKKIKIGNDAALDLYDAEAVHSLKTYNGGKLLTGSGEIPQLADTPISNSEIDDYFDK